jgi:hypothetical protein
MFAASQKLYVLLATVSLVPIRSVDDAVYRLDIVDAIVSATDDEHEQSLLVLIGARESGYRRDVGTCQADALGPTRGGVDGGPARGVWRIVARSPRERATVCDEPSQQALLALVRVRESLHLCRHLAPADRLGIYTNGRCISNNVHSRFRWVNYD